MSVCTGISTKKGILKADALKDSIMVPENISKKISLKIAIVGGGRACKVFLELFKKNPFPCLDIELAGVCDINPEAEGLLVAKSLGIYTTHNFQDLFKIKHLDGIIELTNDHNVLIELIKHKPERVGVLEHNISRLLPTLVEINERLKSAEEQIALEKMIANFLIHQTNEHIVVLNTDFTLADVNNAFLGEVKKSKKEIIGAYCYKVIHGLDVPCSIAKPDFQCPMIETLRTGESSHVINRSLASVSDTTYYDLVTYPVKNLNGDVIKVIEIWRDITKQSSSHWAQKAEELKADLNRMVQEDRMISLGKLAASCVHQINNPIQGMLTFSHLIEEMLAGDNLSQHDIESFKKYISLMSKELERCGHIVSSLLSFCRGSTMEYKTININDVLEGVITLTRHKMELQGIQLVKDLSAKMLLVEGDNHHLQQCFLNLIFNAMEAMPHGGKLTVSSRFNRKNKSIRIKIQDTGCGIPPENQNYIFDPFFTTKKEGEGTGLGLSIAYGVVKNHKGNISVKSRISVGTTFILDFPAQLSNLHGSRGGNG